MKRAVKGGAVRSKAKASAVSNEKSPVCKKAPEFIPGLFYLCVHRNCKLKLDVRQPVPDAVILNAGPAAGPVKDPTPMKSSS
jgi:hypothetical protein